MVTLEVGKFYINKTFDTILIFEKLPNTRIKTGKDIDLYIGKDIFSEKDEIFAYDVNGNRYEKEYTNAPFALYDVESILIEDNRSVVIALNYISYRTEFIKKPNAKPPAYEEYEIQSIAQDTKEVEFTASIAKVKVGQIVLKKDTDFVDTGIVVEKTDSNTKLTFSSVDNLSQGDTLAFKDKVIEKKIYNNLNVLPSFTINDEEFTIAIGTDEIELGSYEKLCQVKKYLGVLNGVFV